MLVRKENKIVRYKNKHRYQKRVLESKTILDFDVPDFNEAMDQYKADGGFDDEELEIYYNEKGYLTDAGYDFASDLVSRDIEDCLDTIYNKYGSIWNRLDEAHLGDSFDMYDVLGEGDLRSVSVEEDSGVACLNMQFSDHDGSFSIIGCNRSLSEYIPELTGKALVLLFKEKPKYFSSVYNSLLQTALKSGYSLDTDQRLQSELLDEIDGFDKLIDDYDENKKSKQDIQVWFKRHVTPTGIATALSKIDPSRQDIVLQSLVDEDDVVEMNAIAINRIFGNASYSRRRSW